MNQRLIELFIDTNTMQWYNRDGAMGASTPAISAGELAQLNIQLCNGAPDFDESGAVTNPDTRFAGTLAAGEFVVDNNYNWYDPVTLVNAVTSGSAIETLEIQCTTTPRPLGTIILGGTDYVNYCEAVKTETGYLLTLADAEFSPASFTPSVNCDAGSAARNLERPVIVSAQNDSTERKTGLFTGLLDAANPVYESMIEGNQEISGTILEVNIYDDGRSVFRARFDFDCLGAIAASSSAGYIKSNVWTEADSRYIRQSDWTQPDEYQFSADGSTEWHDTQTNDDVYIRIRRPGGEWGQAIKLPAGPQGPQGPQGPSGSGSGDMLKSEYDTDNDGKVDEADQADSALNVGGKTAAQVAAAVDNSHTHSNKTTLDKLGESSGKLTFDGAEVGGGTAGSVAWDDVTGKPSDFPPSDHVHEISDVNGLQSALDAKGTVKSVNGIQPDGEGNVTIETGGGGTVDESRLLPKSAEDGDIAVFNASSTTGGGNDETTKFLLQPLKGEEIVDSAAGNAAPVAVTNNGQVTVGAEGGMVFTGKYESMLQVKENTFPPDLFNGTHEYTIDVVYNAVAPSGDRACIFGKGEPDGRFDFLLNSSGALEIGGGPNLGSGWPFGTNVQLTFEVYKDGEQWKYCAFRDGAVVTSGNYSNDSNIRKNFFPIGSDGYYRHFTGTIFAFRISNTALHRGTAFSPEPLPWTKPQVVGSWEAKNIDEAANDIISAHNADPAAHPDKLPLSGGTMTGELKINTSNALRIIQGDYGAIFRSDGRSLYILLTDSGNQNGTFNALRPFTLSLSTGRCSISGVAGAPNYAAMVDLSSEFQGYGTTKTHSFTSDGWVQVDLPSGTPDPDARINNTFKVESTYNIHPLYPVAMGDTLSIQIPESYSGWLHVYFYPKR